MQGTGFRCNRCVQYHPKRHFGFVTVVQQLCLCRTGTASVAYRDFARKHRGTEAILPIQQLSFLPSDARLSTRSNSVSCCRSGSVLLLCQATAVTASLSAGKAVLTWLILCIVEQYGTEFGVKRVAGTSGSVCSHAQKASQELNGSLV